MSLLQLPFARSCCLTFFWVVFLFFDSVFPYVLIEKRSQFLPTNNTSSTRLDLPADQHLSKTQTKRFMVSFIWWFYPRLSRTHIDAHWQTKVSGTPPCLLLSNSGLKNCCKMIQRDEMATLIFLKTNGASHTATAPSPMVFVCLLRRNNNDMNEIRVQSLLILDLSSN